MKTFSRKAFAVLTLALVLTAPAFAGEMQHPVTLPPGEMPTPTQPSQTAPGEIYTGATGDIYGGLAEAVLSVLQSVLTPF